MRNRTLPHTATHQAQHTIVVHNHITINGNGNIVNNGHDMSVNTDSRTLLTVIQAQADTISRLLAIIEALSVMPAQTRE